MENIKELILEKHVRQYIDTFKDCNKEHCWEAMSKNESYNVALRAMDEYACVVLQKLLNNQEEIISSPIRFNGVHVDKIKRIFEESGIKYNFGF